MVAIGASNIENRYIIILAHSCHADTCAHIICDNDFSIVNGTSAILPINVANHRVLATHTH